LAVAVQTLIALVPKWQALANNLGMCFAFAYAYPSKLHNAEQCGVRSRIALSFVKASSFASCKRRF